MRLHGAVSAHVEKLCRNAHTSWTEGFPKTEEPFMNHIVGEFRRSCPTNVTIVGLHRQGTNSVDLHGSDLAFSVTKGSFEKLAVFQVKRILNGEVELEYDQLDDAMKSGHPKGVFFILAVDTDTFDIRIGSVESEFRAWPNRLTPRKNGPPGPQISRRVVSSSWRSLRPWVKDWLQCNVGRISHADFQTTQQDVFNLLSGPAQVRSKPRPKWLPSVLLKIAIPDGDPNLDWS